MKKIIFVFLTMLVLGLAGCGSSDNPPPQPFIAQILSDNTLDGDIARTVGGGTTIITQGTSTDVQSFLAGFNPVNGDEFRAFLQFPLRDIGGVPRNAVIASATLDFVIIDIQPNPLSESIPLRIDLVELQPATLVADDFNQDLQPALATMTISPPISRVDIGPPSILIDVTPLMVKAQQLGLPRFQVRILRDPGTTTPGLIKINDTTGSNRATLAPLLEVSYSF